MPISQDQIEFLGYIISAERITLSPRYIEVIKKFKQPRNVQEVQRFLGLCSYFRKFIQDYALKARLLQDLLKKSSKFKFDKQPVHRIISIFARETDLKTRTTRL